MVKTIKRTVIALLIGATCFVTNFSCNPTSFNIFRDDDYEPVDVIIIDECCYWCC